ncbi:MAG TPA: FISUMP domain-containing protein, partial [Candidatus Gracilibacteria bacterium]|nr:FISUMP domain-containing protein [Candidatus Gracilibacteria bacterium]
PTDGASDQSLTIELKWNGSNKTYSYTLKVSKNSLFSEFLYNQIGITDTKRTISGLDDSTTYYWRVSATNSYGTSDYSSVWSFSTYIIEAPAPCPGVPTVTYEGKTYNTVKIKNQCWLKENLNVGTKINGSNIQTNDSTIEKYCYNDYEQHCNLYGGLYQWEEALQYNIAPGSKGICPAGWHIPTLAEFETLRAAVHNNGNSLKELGEGTGNGKGTNSSGFSVLLAGLRYSSGGFNSLRMFTVFWSSTASVSGGAYNLFLDFESNGIDLSDEDKAYGFSVRCLKNN